MDKRPTYEELEQRVKDLEKIRPEHKRTEERLRLEKKRLESLIRNSPLALVTLDAREEYMEDAESYTRRSLKGEVIDGSGKRYRKDGTLIDVEFFGVPVIVEGKVEGAYGIYRDISQLTQAEKALRESEAKYRTILESIEEGYL